MSNTILDLHRDELFRKFMLQKGIEWGKLEESGIEGVSVEDLLHLWKHLFNNVYAAVSNGRKEQEGKFYCTCREFICKNW